MPAEFRRRVIEALGTVEAGMVVSYGDLAAQAGYPGAARGVGAVLASPRGDQLAWWRVVYGDGRLAPCNVPEQTRRLTDEGIPVRDGRVQLPGKAARGGGPGGRGRGSGAGR